YRELSAQGSRVLAVAYAVAPLQAAYSASDERELVLAGFVTFFDPPMKGVAETLRALRRDGVVVKILTGDNELVAKHVCGQVGLDSTRIVAGDEIERMTDSALAAVAEQTTVFARVSPAQKNRIILALKSRNHVVGFLGDGINDAPSIHTADVGVSVATAVDVAKDAPYIILLERDLDVLHAGILEGRRAFRNVMKYVQTGTVSTPPRVVSVLRTAGSPLRSRPSLALAVTTVLVVLSGVILPFTPLSATLGFLPLPGAYFVFLGGVTITYLVLVEMVKRRLMRK